MSDGSATHEQGPKVRKRFVSKLLRMGFEARTISRADLFDSVMETFALVFPKEAYSFTQVLILGRQIREVAAELEENEDAVRKRISGRDDTLGAEDLFIIILELYREADSILTGGADTLNACFQPAVTGERNPLSTLLVVTEVPDFQTFSFQRSVFLAILEAAIGGAIRELVVSLPWRDRGGRILPPSENWRKENLQTVLTWPYLRKSPPLERSLLPGLLVVMHESRVSYSHKDLSFLCFLILILANLKQDHSSPFAASSWAELLKLLNTNVRGNSQRLEKILTDLPPLRRYATLGFLSRALISTPELGQSINDDLFPTLPPSADLLYCIKRCLELT